MGFDLGCDCDCVCLREMPSFRFQHQWSTILRPTILERTYFHSHMSCHVIYKQNFHWMPRKLIGECIQWRVYAGLYCGPVGLCEMTG